MFGSEFAGVDDATVVAAIADLTRAEAATAARRLAAIAELKRRRVLDEDERALWACDGWDCAAAEVAAAMNVSSRRASGQMRIAEALRDHLPAVAALFGQGELSARVVAAITWRTQFITEAAVWAQIDQAIAKRAVTWGPLAQDKLIAAVDALVLEFDASALMVSKTVARSCDFVVGDREDENGVTSVWGRLSAADALVLKKTIAAMVATVCENDPRSAGERRAAAVGAWSHGNDHLPCACESPTCPARGAHPAPRSSVVVNVYTDQATVDGLNSNAAQTPASATPTPSTPASAGTALLSGTEVMPTPLLAELLRNGAKLRPLCTPADAEPESRYRPSASLARFIRARDLTCRFPGCTTAAEFCDIDHVIPYPLGATHASNLVCLCRKHHLLKTFWTGDWELTLRPDGAAVWTSPTGHTYTTYPGSRAYFPEWDTHTGDLPPPPQPQTFSTDRDVMMPQRRRTRAQDRAARIKTARAQNNSPPPF
ncbi:MAG: HNH endonuclease [Mycobacteriaceae bacterium]|nr:HNH endonuclease [Mycobacteriaceae bacterium]